MLLASFDLALIPEAYSGQIAIRPSSRAEARAILEAAGSGISDSGLAALISQDLGVRVPTVSTIPTLHPGDEIVVAVRRGTPPKPGKPLPTDGSIDYFLIDIGSPDAWIVRS